VFEKVDYNKNGLIEPLEVEVAILSLYNIVNKRLPGWQVRAGGDGGRGGCVLSVSPGCASLLIDGLETPLFTDRCWPARAHPPNPPLPCPALQDPPSREEIQAALKAFDDDHNGALDQPEFERFARSFIKGGCVWCCWFA
jgi:hypothetical protein